MVCAVCKFDSLLGILGITNSKARRFSFKSANAETRFLFRKRMVSDIIVDPSAREAAASLSEVIGVTGDMGLGIKLYLDIEILVSHRSKEYKSGIC
eukprot:g45280.t1